METKSLEARRIMKNVLIRGPLLTQSGYGCHSRQIVKWLLSKHDINVACQVLPWGNTPWFVDANALNGLVGKIMSKSGPLNSPYDVSVQVQLPNEWDPKLGKFNVGITAAVETDKCNPEWITACNKMDLIIVPSTHAKSNLTNTGEVKTKIIVVPESYVEAIAKPATSLQIQSLPTFSTPFNFLVFGQLTGNNAMNDRKNTFFTLKWLIEEFKDDPSVGIILKTNIGRNTLIDRNNVVGMINQLLGETRKGQFPKVHILHGDMSDDEVAALYKHPQVKALVSLTRGEGYGLPILEAATSGLPVVATGWSGHLDFLKHGKYISIYYQLEAIHQSRIDNKIFMPGARWANPSEQDFKKRISKFRNSSAIPQEWAVELQTKLLELYSFDAISKQYDEALTGIIC